MEAESRKGSALRLRAALLFETGASRARVARELGVSRASATHWYRSWRAGGAEALVAGRPLGRRPKLDAAGRERVNRIAARPPRNLGYDLERWSLAALSAAIRRALGIDYHPRHLPRVLRKLGWVVPPVGKHAALAFRQVQSTDPEGNGLLLRQLWPGS